MYPYSRKDFVLYAGVLDLATQKGLLKLEVELIQFPCKENGNEAICRAVAVGKSGTVFGDIGDANQSVNASVLQEYTHTLKSYPQSQHPSAFNVIAYLPRIKGSSDQTIKAYRDVFSLFLPFAARKLSIQIASLRVEHLTPEMILSFLEDTIGSPDI